MQVTRPVVAGKKIRVMPARAELFNVSVHFLADPMLFQVMMWGAWGGLSVPLPSCTAGSVQAQPCQKHRMQSRGMAHRAGA